MRPRRYLPGLLALVLAVATLAGAAVSAAGAAESERAPQAFAQSTSF